MENGAIVVEFPAQMTDKPIHAKIHRTVTDIRKDDRGKLAVFNRFVIQAFEKADLKKPVSQFKKPIKITVKYNPKTMPMKNERDLTIVFWETTMKKWLQIYSVVDTELKTVTATTNHFTDFGLGEMSKIASYYIPGLKGFQTDLFTGAAGASYELEAPPGRGGLTPKLALNYSSSSVDGMGDHQQASFVGLGWRFGTNYIARDPRVWGTMEDNVFTLILNGVSYELARDATDPLRYRALDEQYWYIKREAGSDSWTVTTNDGTKYFFGISPDSQAKNIRGDVTAGNAYLEVYAWWLATTQDTNGNTINYTFQHDTDGGLTCWFSPYEAPTYDRGVYPKTITYNGGLSKIEFFYSTRYDYDKVLYYCTPGVYSTLKLDRAEVSTSVNGQMQLIRKYEFVNDYSTFPWLYWPDTGVAGRLTLKNIKQYGTDGSLLPAFYSFGYEYNRLKTVENGIGGKTTYTYDVAVAGTLPDPNHYRVVTKTVEDGNGGVETFNYTYSGIAANDATHSFAAQSSNPLHSPGSEFRGHEAVTVTDAAGNKTENHFRQDDFFAGRAITITQMDGSNNKYTRTLNNYGSTCIPVVEWVSSTDSKNSCTRDPYPTAPLGLKATGQKAYFIYLASTTRETYEGQTTPKTTLTNYIYDAFGNRIQTDEYSDATTASFSDPFDTKNTSAWTYSAYQTVPFNDAGQNVVKSTGTGVDYTSSFYRNTYNLTHGQTTSIDFKVDATESWLHLALDSNDGGTYSRIGVDAAEGKIFAEFLTNYPAVGASYHDLINPVKLNTWYRLTMRVDDVSGFKIEIRERDSAGASNSYTYAMPSGKHWKFVQWIYQNTAYLDNYAESMDYPYIGMNLYRSIRQTFYPNTAAWIVNKVGLAQLYDTLSNPKSETRYFYDNNSSYTTPPTKGEVTRVDVLKDSSNSFTSMTNGYDTYGNLLTTTDAMSHTTTIAYDTTYNLFPANVWNALGQPTASAYDYRFGKVSSTIDANGAKTSYAYDVFGRTTDIWLPNEQAYSATVHYDYSLGNPRSQVHVKVRKDVGGPDVVAYQEAWWFFDGLGRVIQRQTQSATSGQIILVNTAYTSTGQVGKTSNPYAVTLNGGTYQPPIWDSAHPYTEQQYDAVGRIQRVINPDGTLTYHGYMMDTYGGYGISPTGMPMHGILDENNHAKHFIQDAFGRTTKVREFTGECHSGCGEQWLLYSETSYGYDILNNLVIVADAQGNQTVMNYDWLGRKNWMTDPDMGRWDYGYDNAGNLTSQTDAKGQTINFSYDALNRLSTKTYNPPSGMTSVGYTYDAQLADQFNTLNSSVWTFNSYQSLYNDGGNSVVKNTGSGTGYNAVFYRPDYVLKHGDAVRLEFKSDSTDPRVYLDLGDGTRSFAIVMWGGPIYVIYTDPTWTPVQIQSSFKANVWYVVTLQVDDVNGFYAEIHERDNPQIGASYRYRMSVIGGKWRFGQSLYNAVNTYMDNYREIYGAGIGRRTGMTDGSGSAVWGYDFQGRLITETKAINGAPWPSYITEWKYDAMSRLRKMTYPDGEVIKPTFDNQGLPATLEPYVSSASYNASSQLLSVNLGNGVATNYSYDPANLRLTTLRTGPGNSLQNLSYAYDPVGNIKTITDTARGENANFTYDDLNRLTDAQLTGGSSPYSQHWDYSKIGNILTRTLGSTVTGYAYNPTNPMTRPHAVTHLNGVPLYSYDNNGNMTNHAGDTLVYDADNRLKQATTGSGTMTAYTYDGDGNRVKKAITAGGVTTTTFYIGNYFEVTPTAISSFQESSGMVVMDAEHYNSAISRNFQYWAHRTDVSGYVNAGFMRAEPDQGTLINSGYITSTPEMRYSAFFTTTGTYYVWIRGWAPDDANNSVHVGLDNQQVSTADRITFYTYNTWVWSKDTIDGVPATITVTTSGLHTINVWMREDGLRLDRLLLTTDGNYTPSGSGPAESQGGFYPTKYYYIGAQRVAMRTGAGVTFLHSDHLGSSSAATDASGNQVSSQVYYPYGGIRAGSLPTDYGFTGQKLDASDGLMYYGARYYDAALGRFIQGDPIVPFPLNPQSLNRYAYVLNNPVRYVDPSGYAAACRRGMGSGTGGEEDDGDDGGGDDCYSKPDRPGEPPESDTIDSCRTANCWGRDPSDNFQGETETGIEREWEPKVHFVRDPEPASIGAGGRLVEKFWRSGISIGRDRLQHVYDRHFAAGKLVNKSSSIFDPDVKIIDVIKKAEQVPGYLQTGGNYSHTFDFGQTLGIDRVMGPTSIVTVITDEAGGFVTAFPGFPGPGWWLP